MDRNWIYIVTGFLLVIISVPLFYSVHTEKQVPDNFFFGTSFGLKTVEEAKLLIDEVKDYTNFFLINNWDVSTNETALNSICDYAADAGLTFVVTFLVSFVNSSPLISSFSSCKKSFASLDSR
ncbi:MAG: hypothetical protein P8Y18_02295, partial [Candidatus Bathyarchaeota archaeon]